MKKAFVNGTICSWEKRGNTLIVEDGKVVDFGNDLSTEGFEKIDLKGSYIYPGFVDSHMHLVNCGYTNYTAKLFDVKSMDDFTKVIHTYMKEKNLGPYDWIRGRGWNNDFFQGSKDFPTRYDLDKISKTNPIVLTRVCGHIAVCNSKVLEILNMDSSAPYIEGGEIDVDEQGIPTGIFREAALERLYEIIPPPTLEEVKKMITDTMAEMNAFGITGSHTDDFGNLPGSDWALIIKAYQDLEKEGKLTLRVYEQCLFPSIDRYKGFLKAGYTTGVGSDYFKIGPLKLLLDGALGARTAALRKPYHDDPGNTGILTMEPKTLQEWLTLARDHKMNAAIHCIGDRAMEVAMEGFQKVYGEENQNARNSIVHCQITDHDILESMAENNILAMVQPIFLDYDHQIVNSRVGDTLESTSYAWKTMMDLGIHTSFGTDAPVESFQPFHNIYEAVTRKTLEGKPEGGWIPDQKVSMKEALKAYTVESAYAQFEEDTRGSLSPGQWADFMVLPKDLLHMDPEELKDLKVEATYLGGKKVYG